MPTIIEPSLICLCLWKNPQGLTTSQYLAERKELVTSKAIRLNCVDNKIEKSLPLVIITNILSSFLAITNLLSHKYALMIHELRFMYFQKKLGLNGWA